MPVQFVKLLLIVIPLVSGYPAWAEEAEGEGRPRPFDRLRAAFVELDDDYGSIGTYVLGQTNQLYEQRVRPLYV